MCNINTVEVAYRRKAMWFGIGLSAALFVITLAAHLLWWIVEVVLFVPIYIGAINFLQVRNKFCVSYGGSGRQNADEGSLSAHDVTDKDSLTADKAKSRKMNLQSLLITIVVLALSSLVSFFLYA